LLAERAVRLFESRPDKDWSLTDCLSFMVMAERQLHKALTSDRHFVQAGFEALLLADPS
jgi:predicted nucleic acid-binding protein